MGKKLAGLEKEIADINSAIKAMDQDKTADRKKITEARYELDKLLYSYYKSLKSKYSGPTVLFL